MNPEIVKMFKKAESEPLDAKGNSPIFDNGEEAVAWLRAQ